VGNVTADKLFSSFKPVLLKRKGVALGVWGEVGIGKSYTVGELLAQLPCQSLSLHATTPLATLAQILAKPKKLATWAEHTLARLTKNEAVEVTSTLDAFGATLAGLAPFVLHLEDIHEADAERLEFIKALAQVVLRNRGVALVVTSRKEPPEPFTAIKLEPLSQQEADQVLEQELKASLPKEALHWLYGKAAGNPLYTLEYLRYLTRQGFLWNDGKSWHWRKPLDNAMPVTVEALIEEFLTRAKAEPLHRYVLETRALLALNTREDLWIKVARVNEQDLQTAITELSQQGIFKGNDFAHPLFREVTLKTLNPERKRNLIRRAINALKDELEKAVPLIEDAGLTNQEAHEVLERAAHQAIGLGNAAQAARFRAKAVEYMQGETQSQLIFEIATAVYPYDLGEAIRLLKIAHLAQSDNFDVIKWLAVCLAETGQRAETEALIENLPLTEKTSSRGLMLAIKVLHHLQEPSRVVELWNTHPQLHTTAKPIIVRDVAFSKADSGDVAGALELASKILSQPQLTVEERVVLLETCGYAYYIKADFATSVTYYSEAIELFRANDQAHRTGSLLFNRAIAYQGLAQFSESIVDAEQALELAAEGGHALFYNNAQLALATAQFEQGGYEDSEKRLHECETHYQQKDVAFWIVDTLVVLSELYRDWHTPYAGVLARKHAAKALALSKETDNLRIIVAVIPYAVMAEALFGELQYALELADEGIRLCSNQDNTVTKAKIMRGRAVALSRLGHTSEAISESWQAMKTLQQAGVPLEAQKIGLELDRLNNDIESARTRMHWFEERGLMNGVNIAKRYFPELAGAKETPTPAVNAVRLEVLGSLQFTKQTTTSVRGRKRQELLALLLEARISGRSEVSRLTLLDTLYSSEDELKASSSLKTIIHSLRETLGENTITTTNNGYALGECTLDAELFLQTGDTTLWRGVYLEGLDLDDDSPVRDSLYTALFEKTKTLFETHPKETARVASILVEAEPYNTDYLKIYLTALRFSNQHSKLARHYQVAKERLLEVSETLPDTWQGFLSN
jgi:tetratricopeptide (TPR) repeat protein